MKSWKACSWLLLFALGTALVACGGVSKSASSTAPSKPASTSAAKSQPAAQPTQQKPTQQKLKPVTLQLAWLISGYHAPFVLAQAKGYYRQAGFRVHIVQGRGGTLAVDRVAKGGLTFGVIGAEATILPIAKGAPVKVIATYVHKSPMSFTYHASTQFNTPKDLLGKTVIGGTADVDVQLLPAVLHRYGLRMSQLTIDRVPPSEYPPLFAKNPKAVVVGFTNGDYLRVLQADPHAKNKLYAQFGVNLYDVGLIADDALIKSDPTDVRKFVAASTKGWMEAIAHPQEAVAATMKAFPQANRTVIADGLQRTLALVNTATTKGHPLGWGAPSDWSNMLKLLRQYGGLKSNQPASHYYTDRFVGGA